LLFWRERREYFCLIASMRSFFSLKSRASSSLLRISDFRRLLFLLYEDPRDMLDGAALTALLICDLSWSPRYCRGGLESTDGFDFGYCLSSSDKSFGVGLCPLWIAAYPGPSFLGMSFYQFSSSSSSSFRSSRMGSGGTPAISSSFNSRYPSEMPLGSEIGSAVGG